MATVRERAGSIDHEATATETPPAVHGGSTNERIRPPCSFGESRPPHWPRRQRDQSDREPVRSLRAGVVVERRVREAADHSPDPVLETPIEVDQFVQGGGV